MPSYKTHFIHGELMFPIIDKRIDISLDEFKTYCIGPDALLPTQYSLFERQHHELVSMYFLTLLNLIKSSKLQDNSSVLSFLYAQLDHYVLDLTTHPLIYYYTEGLNSNCLIPSHGIIEHWLDDYIINKYQIKQEDLFAFHNKNVELSDLINQLYSLVYGKNNISSKYDIGYSIMYLYDSVIRKDEMFQKIFPIGEVAYSSDFLRIIPFLNNNHNIWKHPITGEVFNISFDDLWAKSILLSKEMIEDVNHYLYDDKKLDNYYLLNDISYNTGLPCSKGENFQFIKKY